MPCRRQHEAVVLEVLPDLEDRGVLEQRLQQRPAPPPTGTCSRLAVAEVEAAGGGAMAERHVAGLARRHRHREADELGLHGIEAGGLGVEGEAAGRARLGDPGFELRQLGDGLVLRAVDLAPWRHCGASATAACGVARRRAPCRRLGAGLGASAVRRRPARHVAPDRRARPAAAPRRPALRRCASSAWRTPSRAGSRAAPSGFGVAHAELLDRHRRRAHPP